MPNLSQNSAFFMGCANGKIYVRLVIYQAGRFGYF